VNIRSIEHNHVKPNLLHDFVQIQNTNPVQQFKNVITLFMCIKNVKINHRRPKIHLLEVFWIFVKNKWISNLQPSCDLMNARVFDGQGYLIIDIHLHYLNRMHSVEVVGFNFTCTTYSIDVIWLDELVWCNMNYLW